MPDATKPLPQFKILLLNDDYTPMESVTAVLTDLFEMSKAKAVDVMLKTHRQGTYALGPFEESKARTMVRIIQERAREGGHPFECVLQADS